MITYVRRNPLKAIFMAIFCVCFAILAFYSSMFVRFAYSAAPIAPTGTLVINATQEEFTIPVQPNTTMVKISVPYQQQTRLGSGAVVGIVDVGNGIYYNRCTSFGCAGDYNYLPKNEGRDFRQPHGSVLFLNTNGAWEACSNPCSIPAPFKVRLNDSRTWDNVPFVWEPIELGYWQIVIDAEFTAEEWFIETPPYQSEISGECLRTYALLVQKGEGTLEDVANVCPQHLAAPDEPFAWEMVEFDEFVSSFASIYTDGDISDGPGCEAWVWMEGMRVSFDDEGKPEALVGTLWWQCFGTPPMNQPVRIPVAAFAG